MGSLIEELEKRVQEHPEKLLFAFLTIKGEIKESYTYREFDQRTDSIATFLHENYELKSGDRVLLAYPPGLEVICAFFACVKLGLIPVPVYPPSAQSFESSVEKMSFIANDCDAAAILTDRSYFWSIKVNLSRLNQGIHKKINESISNIKWIISDDAVTSAKINYPRSHSEILFLQYTSGSTSDPKGVIVTHDNLIYNCHSVVDHDPIGVSWLPQYHDMGLIGYYLFFVIRGGTTYGFSPTDFIQRPALWLETISKYRATATSAPNFAYDYCLIPNRISEEVLESIDLSSLTFVMNAAEPINTDTYQAFIDKFKQYGLNPASCFGAYGLAEFTLAVSSRGTQFKSFDKDEIRKNKVKEVDPSSESDSIMSCGKPLKDTSVLIVDSVTQKEVSEQNGVGEIWLNGTSKCLGYWGRTELTEKVFNAKIEGFDGSWLRTGDLGFVLNEELYICGRTKDMIIIRGLNYYPQDIEGVIERDQKVRKSCVAAFALKEHDVEHLAIVIGVKNKKKLPDTEALNAELTKHFGIAASTFVFVPARTISKTSSGKIMRFANKERLLNNTHEIIERIDLDLSNMDSIHIPVAKETFDPDSYEYLFQRYGLRGNESQALGDAGLDSMKLAEFAHDLKSYIKNQGFEDLADEVELRLLQKIAVSEMFAILADLKKLGIHARLRFKQAFSRIHKEFEAIEKKMMKKDASIEIEELNNISELANKTYEQGKILLTGGTGFFGPFILKGLLEQNSNPIIVMVRASDNVAGMKRLKDAFALIEPSDSLLDKFDSRVEVVCGDIAKSNMGLKQADYDHLSSEVDTIYHNGALVNYLLDYESMRNANAGGTVEIVRLACTDRLKTLNHISTTFIFGWSVKDTLFESDGNENMENLDFGYSQSKWVSEQIVKRAMEKGLNARIFRPALISPSIDGKGYNYDISIRLLTFMIKYGVGTSAKNQVSFSPADIAANNIVAISNIEESINKMFQVTRDRYSNLEDVTNLFQEYTGRPFEVFSLNDFVPVIVDRCTKEDVLFPLLNFLVKSEEKISKMEFKLYDNSNYRNYRDQSKFGIADKPLADVVYGILKFMKDQELIETEIIKRNEHVE